jgi:hypothetical protein
MRIAFATVVLFLFALNIHAQEKIITRGIVVNGDTIPVFELPPVDIIALAVNPLTAEQLKQYYKLRRDVLRTYPYAKLAGMKLKEINERIAKIPKEKDRRKYLKETEKQLKKEFEKDLKNLTVTQGKILIKLIDRETGSTTYYLVKELRGSLQAFIWQGVAKIFGSNLKTNYDSTGNDRMIESIVRAIERGELKANTVRKNN